MESSAEDPLRVLPVLFKNDTFLLLHKPAGLPLSGSKPLTLMKSLSSTLHSSVDASETKIQFSVPRALAGPTLLSFKRNVAVPDAVFDFRALVHGKVQLPFPPLESVKILKVIQGTAGPLTLLCIRTSTPGNGLRKVLANAGHPVLGGGSGARQSGGCNTRRTHLCCSRVQIADLHVDIPLQTPGLDRQLKRESKFAERKAVREAEDPRVCETSTGKYVRFINWWFHVDESVMRPRQTSEIVAETAASYLNDGNLLDLGTGSGALLCATLLMTKGYGVGVEICPHAAKVADGNVRSLQLGERAEIVSGDFARLGDIGTFNVVVSNPPYLTPREIHMKAAKLAEDPMLALCGGHDGMQGYVAVAGMANNVVVNGGVLVVEVGSQRDIEAVRTVFEKRGMRLLETRVDFRGVERVAVFRKG